MPPGNVVWCLLLLTAILYAVSAFVLRLSCVLANSVGRVAGPAAGPAFRMPIPGYWATLGILFAACFLMGILESTVYSVTSLFGGGCLEGQFARAATLTAEMLLFALLIAGWLRPQPQVPRSLALLAALLYVILLFALILPCARLLLAA